MKKFLSIILCVLILCATFPLSVFADEIGYDTVSEAVELREENVKHFLNPDGSYTALAYSKPVHRLDENGNWQDLENIMNEETRGNKQAYITSDGRTVFSKKINSTDNEIFTLNEGKYEISVSFVNEGLKNTTAKLSNHAKKYTPSKFDKLETQYKKLKEIDTTTTLLYKNALSGIDLEYVLSVNDVKENIIVRKLQDEYSYSFIYELNGLLPELQEDGSISLKDKETLEKVYSLPAPYMFDNSGETSQDVEYILTDKGNDTYEITVHANAEWINSPERDLPVVIDPTFSGGANGLDTYIDAYYPDTNYGNSTTLYVSANQFAYMSHASLYNLVDSATITSASISLQYSTTATSGSAVIKIHPVTTSWKENTWTWNTAVGYTNRGLSYSNTSTATLTASTTTRTVNIDLTNFYHSAYAGMPYYGIGISYISGSIPTITIPSGEATRIVYTINYEKNAPIASGTYLLASGEDTEQVIQLNNNSTNVLEVWNFDGNADQKWTVKYLHNGYYKIISAENGKAIAADVEGISDLNVYLQSEIYDYSNYRHQWQISVTSSGKYKLSPRSNLDEAMTVFTNDDGRNIRQTSYSNNEDYDDEWYAFKIGYESSVPLEGQQMSNWCWATTARMFAKHFYPEVSLTQAQAVNSIKQAVVDQPGTLGEAYSAINYYISNITLASIDMVGYSGAIYSEERLVNFLNVGSVVYVALQNYVNNNGDYEAKGTGHSVLIYGYVTNNSNNYFLIKDPAPMNEGDIYILSYNDLCSRDSTVTVNGIEGPARLTWAGSIVKNTSFANDLIPPDYE